MKISTKLTNYLKNLTGIRVSPNSDIHQGVQAFTTVFLGLLTSFGLSAIISGALFSDSAYAAYSASISRTSSGTIMLSDGSGSSIKPSSTGTLGTGSDTVSVSSNCTAGYNLYVSAISGGSTNLSTDGGADYIPSTTTATGSEAALTKDTWGVGKNGSTFSKLPAYSTDASTWTALYTETGDSSSTAKNYTVYYGANVSTAKTPGTYTGDVLYTVVMNSACEKFTLSYNGNGATTNNLSSEELAFDATIDLSIISSTDKIAKTGYHLTGWQDQDGNSYGITGEVDINPNDLTTVTLTAIWAANTYTIKYAAGSTGGTCNVSDTPATYDQDVTLSSTKCTKTNYEQKGWSINPSGTPKSYDLGKTLTKPNLASINGDHVTLYPYFESTTTYFQTTNSCSTISVGTTGTLVDSRDNQSYTVYRWPSSGTAGTAYPTAMAGYCIMTKDLGLGYVTGGSVTKGGNLTLTTSDSAAAGTITARTSTSNWSTTNSDSNLQYINGTNATYGTHAYYSYGAAQKVCPKGWRPPTNTEYGNIATFMGGNNSTGSGEIRGTPYNFVYGGNVYSSGWYNVGSYGLYWSSAQRVSSVGYDLRFDSSSLYTDSANKDRGRSVRCVAAP